MHHKGQATGDENTERSLEKVLWLNIEQLSGHIHTLFIQCRILKLTECPSGGTFLSAETGQLDGRCEGEEKQDLEEFDLTQTAEPPCSSGGTQALVRKAGCSTG